MDVKVKKMYLKYWQIAQKIFTKNQLTNLTSWQTKYNKITTKTVSNRLHFTCNSKSAEKKVNLVIF